MDAALTLAGVDMSDEQKVTLFTRGLKDAEDRVFVLQKRPTNLKEAYQAVVTLTRRQALFCAQPQSLRTSRRNVSSGRPGPEAE